MRKALAIFLALVLSISAISEGILPSETEAPTEEVTIETYEEDEETDDSNKTLGEESEQETPEVLSEESEDVSENSVQDIKENDGSDVELSSEEIVNEDIEARTNDAEEILDDTEEATENTIVDDSGSGTSDDEEAAEEQTEEETASGTESSEDYLADENRASTVQYVEASTELVIGEINEEGMDKLDNGSGELDAPAEEEEESSEAEEDNPEILETGESEDSLLEDGSSLETEEISEEQAVAEVDEQTDDEVSGGNSVLTEAPMMAFAMAPVLTSASKEKDYTKYTYEITAENYHKYLYSDDATNEEEIVWTADIPDETVQFTVTIKWNGGSKTLKEQGLISSLISSLSGDTGVEYRISYSDLYSYIESNGDCSVTISCTSNGGRDTTKSWPWSVITKTVSKTYDFVKYSDTVTATISYESTDYFPGDTVKLTAKFSALRSGQSVIDEYTIVGYEWYINDEIIDETSSICLYNISDCEPITVQVIIEYYHNE